MKTTLDVAGKIGKIDKRAKSVAFDESVKDKMKRTRRFRATRSNVDKIKEYAFRFSGRINLAQERRLRRGNSRGLAFGKQTAVAFRSVGVETGSVRREN